MDSCEIYPQTVSRNPNGRFVVVCGDGEYIIYTAMALRNKAFGQAQDSSEYAIRENRTSVQISRRKRSSDLNLVLLGLLVATCCEWDPFPAWGSMTGKLKSSFEGLKLVHGLCTGPRIVNLFALQRRIVILYWSLMRLRWPGARRPRRDGVRMAMKMRCKFVNPSFVS